MRQGLQTAGSAATFNWAGWGGEGSEKRVPNILLLMYGGNQHNMQAISFNKNKIEKKMGHIKRTDNYFRYLKESLKYN